MDALSVTPSLAAPHQTRRAKLMILKRSSEIQI